AVLREVVNMTKLREYEDPEGAGGVVHVYGMDGEGPHAELHVAVRPDLPPARLGAGGVHHVAFRAPDDRTHRAWLDRLTDMRVPNSGWVDRIWFRSIYFREPGGVLFEIAAGRPGFASDEDPGTGGGPGVVPPCPEPRRGRTGGALKPLDWGGAGGGPPLRAAALSPWRRPRPAQPGPSFAALSARA